MCHLLAFRREVFPARYHQWSNVETTFSTIEMKFGDSLRSKSEGWATSTSRAAESSVRVSSRLLPRRTVETWKHGPSGKAAK